GSRTRKRHRDDRPEEGDVYASTLKRLFDAQKRHPDASPMPSSQSLPTPSAGHGTPQRSTLHSFWKLPSEPSRRDLDAMDVDDGAQRLVLESLRCEDCDRRLMDDEGGLIVESMIEQETACVCCRRRVCDTCSVSGDRRICLGCAST
ncbi:hypothetical protein BAUCODRAFT_44270, partial [Baudoinia panamericana UAMH 10762]